MRSRIDAGGEASSVTQQAHDIDSALAPAADSLRGCLRAVCLRVLGIALADPKKIVDRPVAVFEHSPRKMAAAARLLPHVRFLQPPERDEDGSVVRTEGGMVVRAAAQSPEEGADRPETDRQMVVREEKDTGALRLENSPTKVWA